MVEWLKSLNSTHSAVAVLGVDAVEVEVDIATAEVHVPGVARTALRTAPVPLILKITLALLVQLLIHSL